MIAAFLLDFMAKLQKRGDAVPSDGVSSRSVAVNLVAFDKKVNGVRTVHPASDV